MNRLFLVVISALFVACQPVLQISEWTCPKPTQNGGATEQWHYESSVSDEFDGALLDTIKWYDYNPRWLGREPSLFKRENVYMRDNMLILRGRRDDLVSPPNGYHTFSSAAVRSKDSVLYGFFEIKCRAMDSALSSAFWLYMKDSIKQEEIDIFEICGRHDSNKSYENTYFATSHYILVKDGTQISDHVAHRTPFRLADEFFVAGLEWNCDEIIWYLNGEVIRRSKNDYWHTPETINFDSEAFPFWWGLPSDDDEGGEFQIEYFRYWSAYNPDDHIYIRK